ncbi:MAG: hypothetical protein ACTHJ3_00855 [Pararhizobium sp.]
MTDEGHPDLARALALLSDDRYRMGEGWRQAHEIAQVHEGEPLFDRLHALCHRIEGNAGNAAYWYRRAGTTPFAASFDEEAQAIRAAAGLS